MENELPFMLDDIFRVLRSNHDNLFKSLQNLGEMYLVDIYERDVYSPDFSATVHHLTVIMNMQNKLFDGHTIDQRLYSGIYDHNGVTHKELSENPRTVILWKQLHAIQMKIGLM